MLTPIQTINTRKELQENYRRLTMEEAEVLRDIRISGSELQAVLQMKNANPGQVWMVRDYLGDKLAEKGIEMYPFSRLADHSANHRF